MKNTSMRSRVTPCHNILTETLKAFLTQGLCHSVSYADSKLVLYNVHFTMFSAVVRKFLCSNYGILPVVSI